MVRWSHFQTQIRVLLVVVILLIGSVGSVGATETVSSGILQTDENPTQSPPDSHQNPAEASQPDEYQGVQGHLEGLLSDRLEDATGDAVEDGDYEEARRTLGGEYDEQLDRYTEAAGDSQAELFVETRDQQYQFIDSNERFDQLQEAYREARREGNDRRARDIRDALQEEAASISERGEDLSSSYREIEERTGGDRSEEIRLIEARQTEVDQFITQTETAGSVETRLLVSADRTNISFDEPAGIDGQLETASSDPVATQNVSILVEDQLYTVRTDSTGRFDLVHRPVDSLGVSTLDVAFVPNATSQYQGASGELPVTVSQIDSDVRIDPPTSAASFDTNLTTEGAVVAGIEDRPVPEVPVALFVDDQRLETIDTNETGQFSFSTAIPQSTTSQETTVEVRTVGTNQSISPSSGSTRVQVAPVETNMTLRTIQDEADSQSVTVAGSLETEGGRPVPNATVDLTVDGETVDSAMTTQNGTFEGPLTLSEDVNNSTATLGATFSGSGTHLQPTTETVDLRPSGGGSERLQPQSPQPDAELSLLALSVSELLLVGVGMVVLFGLLGFWWMRRGRTEPLTDSSVDESTSTESTRQSSRSLFSVAEQQLESKAYEAAIVVAYVAVRRRLGQLFGLPDGVTHRELSQLYADTEHEQGETINDITQAYERARYTTDTVDESVAARALSAAEEILDEVDQSETETR